MVPYPPAQQHRAYAQIRNCSPCMATPNTLLHKNGKGPRRHAACRESAMRQTAYATAQAGARAGNQQASSPPQPITGALAGPWGAPGHKVAVQRAAGGQSGRRHAGHPVRRARECAVGEQRRVPSPGGHPCAGAHHVLARHVQPACARALGAMAALLAFTSSLRHAQAWQACRAWGPHTTRVARLRDPALYPSCECTDPRSIFSSTSGSHSERGGQRAFARRRRWKRAGRM